VLCLTISGIQKMNSLTTLLKKDRVLPEVLNNIKGKFLLSYYYFDGIEDLYPNCKFDSKITIMGTELIIMNF